VTNTLWRQFRVVVQFLPLAMAILILAMPAVVEYNHHRHQRHALRFWVFIPTGAKQLFLDTSSLRRRPLFVGKCCLLIGANVKEFHQPQLAIFHGSIASAMLAPPLRRDFTSEPSRMMAAFKRPVRRIGLVINPHGGFLR